MRLICLRALICLTSSLYCDDSVAGKDSIHHHPKGEDVYLNGMGGDPSEYYAEAFNVGPIFEVANKVISTEKSPYGRPFQTQAVSIIALGDAVLKATLDNFRNLKITDSSGEILSERKITGATSLYEIRQNGKVVAWAVGWHRNNKEAYKDVDFTAFRVYFPVLKNGKIEVQQAVVRGLAQGKFQKALKQDAIVLVAVSQLGCGASGLYYSLPQFLKLDLEQGFVFLNGLKDCEPYVDVDEVEKILAPIVFVLWLIKSREIKRARDYIVSNFDKIVDPSAFNTEKNIKYDPSKKTGCLAYVEKSNKNNIPYSTEHALEVFAQCFSTPVGECSKGWIEDVVIDDIRARFPNRRESVELLTHNSNNKSADGA